MTYAICLGMVATFLHGIISVKNKIITSKFEAIMQFFPVSVVIILCNYILVLLFFYIFSFYFKLLMNMFIILLEYFWFIDSELFTSCAGLILATFGLLVSLLVCKFIICSMCRVFRFFFKRYYFRHLRGA